MCFGIFQLFYYQFKTSLTKALLWYYLQIFFLLKNLNLVLAEIKVYKFTCSTQCQKTYMRIHSASNFFYCFSNSAKASGAWHSKLNYIKIVIFAIKVVTIYTTLETKIFQDCFEWYISCMKEDISDVWFCKTLRKYSKIQWLYFHLNWDNED